jgi:hypothetical protein
VRQGKVCEEVASDHRPVAILDGLLVPNYLLSAYHAIRIYPGEKAQGLESDDSFMGQVGGYHPIKTLDPNVEITRRDLREREAPPGITPNCLSPVCSMRAAQQTVRDAECRFPVRIKIAVPPEGLGGRRDQINAWLDADCGADGWISTPSSTRGAWRRESGS